MTDRTLYTPQTCDRYPDCEPARCPRCKSERISHPDDVDQSRWSCFDCGLLFDACADCEAERRSGGRA